MPTAVKTEQNLARAAERVHQDGKRLPIRRNGRVIAALVPADDLKVLEEMDRLDVKTGRRVMAQAKARGEKPIPWNVVRKRLKI